jgi:methylated-DNA-[protein]-cysteine S-methyltransferase
VAETAALLSHGEQAQLPAGTFRYHSPIGPLDITLEHEAVSRVDFGIGSESGPPPLEAHSPVKRSLDDYFRTGSGPENVEIRINATQFQRMVLEAISSIPPGEVRSYAEIASQIGRRGAARAVGNALAANPVPVFVPCHRVVGFRGLGGYGGGLHKKRLLLDLESRAAVT